MSKFNTRIAELEQLLLQTQSEHVDQIGKFESQVLEKNEELNQAKKEVEALRHDLQVLKVRIENGNLLVGGTRKYI
jgi:ubiquinone biosynthesis protein UbiJ